MGNSVSGRRGRDGGGQGLSLFTPGGGRKYLTRTEQRRVMVAFERLPVERALFALTLAATGARISEILAVTPAAVHVDEAILVIRTLKRRRLVMREVPIPHQLALRLDAAFGLRGYQNRTTGSQRPLWSFQRTTAWRFITNSMREAGVVGRPASPRGLRHGFGVGTLQAGVPLTLVQRWLGHARLSTTAIYADVSGEEERWLADRYWSWLSACNTSTPLPGSDRERLSSQRM